MDPPLDLIQGMEAQWYLSTGQIYHWGWWLHQVGRFWWWMEHTSLNISGWTWHGWFYLLGQDKVGRGKSVRTWWCRRTADAWHISWWLRNAVVPESGANIKTVFAVEISGYLCARFFVYRGMESKWADASGTVIKGDAELTPRWDTTVESCMLDDIEGEIRLIKEEVPEVFW